MDGCLKQKNTTVYSFEMKYYMNNTDTEIRLVRNKLLSSKS